MSNPAAWHPDPTGKHEYRYWDGDRWTQHVSDAGQVTSDPLDGGGPATSDRGGSAHDATDPSATDQATTDRITSDGGSSAAGVGADGRDASDLDDPATRAADPASEPSLDAGAADRDDPHGGAGGLGSTPNGPSDASAGWADGGTSDRGAAPPPGDSGAGAFGAGAADTAAGSGWQQPEASGPPPSYGAPQQQPQWGQPQQQQPAWDQGQGQGRSDQWGQQGSQGWQQGGQRASAGNGLAIAALIVGILSLLVSFIPFVGLIAVLGGIIAAVLGFIARSKAKKGEATGGGMALAGIITGLLGLVLSIVISVGLVMFGQELVGDSLQDYEECLDGPTPQEECDERFQENITDRFS